MRIQQACESENPDIVGLDWEAFTAQTRAFMAAVANDEKEKERYVYNLRVTLPGFGLGSYEGSFIFVGEGDSKQAVPDGRGIWTQWGDLDDHCQYIGDWVQGKRHGFGTMRR